MLRMGRLPRRNYLFNRICRHTIKLAMRTGLDNAGELVYGAPISYAALVEMVPHEILDKEGTQRVAGGWAILAFPPPSVDPSFQITLPDGSTPVIRRVDYDFNANPTLPTVIHF